MSPSHRLATSSSTRVVSRSGRLSVSVTRHARPSSHMASSIARMMGASTGLVRSGTTTPMVPDRRVRRLRAVGSGWYPSASAAAWTLRDVSAVMRPGSAGLSAREAVAGWTPARWATSLMVGRRLPDGCSIRRAPSSPRMTWSPRAPRPSRIPVPSRRPSRPSPRGGRCSNAAASSAVPT